MQLNYDTLVDLNIHYFRVGWKESCMSNFFRAMVTEVEYFGKISW